VCVGCCYMPSTLADRPTATLGPCSRCASAWCLSVTTLHVVYAKVVGWPWGVTESAGTTAVKASPALPTPHSQPKPLPYCASLRCGRPVEVGVAAPTSKAPCNFLRAPAAAAVTGATAQPAASNTSSMAAATRVPDVPKGLNISLLLTLAGNPAHEGRTKVLQGVTAAAAEQPPRDAVSTRTTNERAEAEHGSV
jgi:hypothetical protein